MMTTPAVITIAISVAGVFVIPGVVGLVRLIRQGDAQASATRELASAVQNLAKAVDEIHGDHKELRKDHTALDNRVVRIEAERHRIATLEGPRRLIGRWGTHEGKDGAPRRVKIVGVRPEGDGNPPRYTVRYDCGNRPPIEYAIAADQVTLES